VEIISHLKLKSRRARKAEQKREDRCGVKIAKTLETKPKRREELKNEA